MDISAKLDVDDLEVNNNNLLEPNEEPHIEEEDVEANILATKFTHSPKAEKLVHDKKPATKLSTSNIIIWQ